MFKNRFADLIMAFAPTFLLVLAAGFVAYKFVNPAPPKKIVISTGDGEGDYQAYAKLYRDLIKEDGIEVEIRTSKGAQENLQRLQDKTSGVDAGFVEDGLGATDKQPDISSLGSLYYEPIWIFYRGKSEIRRLSELKSRKISMGINGGGTYTIVTRILGSAGVTDKNTTFIELGPASRAEAIKTGKIDVAFFMAAPDDEIVDGLMKDRSLKLMNLDQAEAIARQMPYLHHLTFPHGAIDLKENIPDHDIDLISPTATLLVRDSIHPALEYLLLKAATQVHSGSGLLEKKNEFPIDKNYVFPLTDEAEHYYKNGVPFWQRYLPFWLANLVERFIIVFLPLVAIIIPVFKLIPKILDWRLKNRFYRNYGELKFLEGQIREKPTRETYKDYLHRLDQIEERVNLMKAPLDFSDHIYHLKAHIHYVRRRLDKLV